MCECIRGILTFRLGFGALVVLIVPVSLIAMCERVYQLCLSVSPQYTVHAN